jgi:hypothetical protein
MPSFKRLPERKVSAGTLKKKKLTIHLHLFLSLNEGSKKWNKTITFCIKRFHNKTEWRFSFAQENLTVVV